MAAYQLRVTRPGQKPRIHQSTRLQAPQAAYWATRDGEARAEILVDGEPTSTYENGTRLKKEPTP